MYVLDLLKRQVFVVFTLAIRVHLYMLHEHPYKVIPIRGGAAVTLHIVDEPQPAGPHQPTLYSSRHQVGLGLQVGDVLKVLEGQGQVRLPAEGGGVVEDLEHLLVAEEVQVFGRLLVEQRPLVGGVAGHRQVAILQVGAVEKEHLEKWETNVHAVGSNRPLP